MPSSDCSFFSTLAEHTLQAMPITGIVFFICFLYKCSEFYKQKLSYLLFYLQNYILIMEEKRFMVKNFWLLHENHYNKVDENAMFQVRAQKKAGSKLLWNLPPSFMGDDYLTSMFFVVLASSLGVSFGISTSSIPSATFAEIFSRSASSGSV